MYLLHCLYTSIQTNDDVFVAQCVVLSRRTEKITTTKKNKQGCYKRKVLMGHITDNSLLELYLYKKNVSSI